MTENPKTQLEPEAYLYATGPQIMAAVSAAVTFKRLVDMLEPFAIALADEMRADIKARQKGGK